MLEVTEIGLILQSADGNEFRHITIKDEAVQKSLNYIVFKKTSPYLWKSIEKFENGTYKIHELNGNILHYNGLDIVVFEGESEQEAYEKQKLRELPAF